MTAHPQLDWSTAEVSEGQLTLGLTEKPSKQWRGVFERTAALLSAGTWEVALKAKKASVQISPIRPGDEERVRQFIEGVVQEANTRTGGADESSSGEDTASDEPAESQPSPDEQLTEHFRSFAESSQNEPADSKEAE